MSERQQQVRELLAPLREAELPPESEQALAATRARVLPELQAQAMRLPARRAARRRVQVGAGAGALAMAAAAWLMLEPTAATTPGAPTAQSAATRANAGQGLQLLQLDSAATAGGSLPASGGSVIDASGARHELSSLAGKRLPSTARRLTTGAEAARLRTPGGASIELAADSQLDLTPDALTRGAESLHLARGEVHCQVPPLGPAGRFAIETPTARVVVHGTRFRVRVDEGTCVRVTEGLVAVHPRSGGEDELRLGPGEQWGCEQSQPSAERGDDAAEGAGATAHTPQRKARGPRRARGSAEDRALEVENALLRDALRAERAGERERACELFGELLQRHPDTPLADVARAGRERCR
jgi:ferric-dicitrate binding protein FerR (iron transport regulator)